MAKNSVVFQVKIAFWVPFYLKILFSLCLVVGCQPCPSKVDKTLSKGVRIVTRPTGRKSILKRPAAWFGPWPFTPWGGANLYSLAA